MIIIIVVVVVVIIIQYTISILALLCWMEALVLHSKNINLNLA